MKKARRLAPQPRSHGRSLRADDHCNGRDPLAQGPVDPRQAGTSHPRCGDGRWTDGAGEGWRRVAISKTGTTRLNIQIARSDWFTQVIQPLGPDQYIVTEIKVPGGSLREGFQKAVQHLESAERAYATGDDPATFFYCRAAIDSLPGAKQNIFDNVTDEPKRARPRPRKWCTRTPLQPRSS